MDNRIVRSRIPFGARLFLARRDEAEPGRPATERRGLVVKSLALPLPLALAVEVAAADFLGRPGPRLVTAAPSAEVFDLFSSC